MRIDRQEQRLSLELIFDVSDLRKVLDLDLDKDGLVTANEVRTNIKTIENHFSEKTEVKIAGKTIALEPLPGVVVQDSLGNMFVRLKQVQRLSGQVWSIGVRMEIFEGLHPLHKNFLKASDGEELHQAILTRSKNEVTIAFGGRAVNFFVKIRQFLWLGIEHIFVGYDHMLFLFAVVLVGGTFGNLVKIVSSFTVAHSITLTLAALQVVLLPGRVVESAIAFSIVYVAAENFFVKDNRGRWLITFCFGLMHGFGFASILAELDLPAKGFAASLFAFNVGVEIGQVVIVALTYPLVLWISDSRHRARLVMALSAVILTLGGLWFLERAFNVMLISS